MSSLQSMSRQEEKNLLIAFADLTNYQKISSRIDDLQVASWMNTFFEKFEGIVEAQGGVVVKFIGDAALVVFEEHLAEQGIRCLLEAKTQIDQWLTHEGYKSPLEVKIHFGSVVAGPFGGRSKKNFDVIGSSVNTAATLSERPFCLSAQAFRQLSPEGRKFFKKHTPPITYIREGDRHS